MINAVTNLAQVEPQLQEQLNLVVVGHVDHGKSTVIGRLMADTGSLPIGKLEQVRDRCARSGRPFEYAFLLDALKNEQAQGITIDTARCFFKTAKRRYIINDAPGHIEFLKNMVTGASRAEAALLVIDAHEGIRENSRRHGYILSLLGLSQLSVLINKMDLVSYDQAVFERVREEYCAFLADLGVNPVSVIPIAARDGSNIATRHRGMSWYDGPTVLEQVDAFDVSKSKQDAPFRMPLQDVYKFTEEDDERRIFAGSIASGRISVGSRVKFLPSKKASRIASIEAFSAPPAAVAGAGQAVGFTLSEQIYVKPGELMVREDDETTVVTTRIRATVFWMGRAPLITDKKYVLKIGAAKVPVELREVKRVVDASELASETTKTQLDRHDVGEVVLETTRPFACDVARTLASTGRFVIVDHFEIAGCGVVLAPVQDGESLLERRIKTRDYSWASGAITRVARAQRYGHQGKFILLACSEDESAEVTEYSERLAIKLEASLFASGRRTYYLKMANLDTTRGLATREEHINSLGEQARVLTDAGLLFISGLSQAEPSELEVLRALNSPAELFLIQVGKPIGAIAASLVVDPNTPPETVTANIVEALASEEILFDYEI
ncbi:MAG TPA: GTP-binding protein [Polyangiaceae bacterium]|nr:GTP-binding protein [Polyangiaceae bacterium]